MAVGDIVQGVTGFDFTKIGQGLFSGISIIFAFIVIGGICAGLGFLYWNHKRFSKKIMIIKNGQFAGTDKARVVKVGDMGNEILFLKTLKVFRNTSGITVAKNTYLYSIDEQGNWHNVGLSNVNRQLKELLLEIASNDQRLANVNIRRLNDRRFNKQNWLKENIGIIAGGLVLIIIVIFLWLMSQNNLKTTESQKNILQSYQESQEQNAEMVRVMTRLVENMDKLVNGESASLIPVPEISEGGT